MTLTTTVTNILNKERVTDEQAKQFALENYGILATYIRQQFVSGLKETKKQKETMKRLLIFRKKLNKTVKKTAKKEFTTQ